MILDTNEELVSGLNAVLQIIVTRPKSVHSLFLEMNQIQELNQL